MTFPGDINEYSSVLPTTGDVSLVQPTKTSAVTEDFRMYDAEQYEKAVVSRSGP